MPASGVLAGSDAVLNLDLFVVPLFWESHYAHFDLGKNLFLIALGRSGACNNHNGPH